MSRYRVAALLALTVLRLAPCALGTPYTLPDAELLSAQFIQLAGFSTSSSTLDGKADVPGPGVAFLVTLAGADDGKIGIGDPWPADPAAGFGWDPVLSHFTSLNGYDRYQMTVTYADGPAGSDIDVGLFLNTGLTGPSGFPSSDLTNDTFWAGPWETLSLGESTSLSLIFAAAEAYNITDNKVPHTGGGLGLADGFLYAINTRDRFEISNIGLQIADFDGDVLGSQITLLLNIPEPTTLTLLALGGLGLRRRRRKTPDA